MASKSTYGDHIIRPSHSSEIMSARQSKQIPTLTSFTHFPRLPAELRGMVWRQVGVGICYKPQVIPFTLVVGGKSTFDASGRPCDEQPEEYLFLQPKAGLVRAYRPIYVLRQVCKDIWRRTKSSEELCQTDSSSSAESSSSRQLKTSSC